jgi:hypothetical protein
VKTKLILIIVAGSIAFGLMMSLRDLFMSLWIRAMIAGAAFAFFAVVVLCAKNWACRKTGDR